MSFLARFRKRDPRGKNPAQKPGLIGLDIGTSQLHLCQLQPDSDGLYTIVAKSSLSFEGGRKKLLDSPQQFKRGDLITFPAGMSCTWEIHEDVEKHYDFQ